MSVMETAVRLCLELILDRLKLILDLTTLLIASAHVVFSSNGNDSYFKPLHFTSVVV